MRGNMPESGMTEKAGSQAAVKRPLLFVQGGGRGAHDDWDARLVESLQRALGPGYAVRYPRMPNEGDPHVATWKPALDQELARLDEGAILVGHSVGGTMLVNVLAERARPPTFAALFLLAAPFVGEGGWPNDELNCPPDLGARLPPGMAVHIFHGTADETAPPAHADLYARAIPQARLHRLPGRNHQLDDDLTEVAAAIGSLDGGRASAG